MAVSDDLAEGLSASVSALAGAITYSSLAGVLVAPADKI
jgi:CTP:molybdopterin cytidylyltransferase MocA